MKACLDHAKTEVVLSHGNFGLLNKFNDLLERKTEYMKATMKTLRMTYQKEGTDHHQSVFSSARKRRSLVIDIVETKGTLKEECVQMTFYPCLLDLYHQPDVYLAKHTRTERTLDSLLCQDVTVTTDMDNIITTFVTD